MTMRRRLTIPLLTLAVALMAAAGAMAFFSSSGRGSASAGAGTLQPVTVAALVAGDAPSSQLLPGGTADVVLRVNNPNPYAVTLINVTGGPGPITADGDHPGCTTTGVTFTDQTGLSTAVAASGTTLVRLHGAASMSTASSSGCQGATFSVPVSITVHKG